MLPLNAFVECFRRTEMGVQGSLGLTGPKALRKIGVLSGGEKARVALAIFVMIPYNLLMLDEPSNHLGESNPSQNYRVYLYINVDFYGGAPNKGWPLRCPALQSTVSYISATYQVLESGWLLQ